MEIYQFSEWLLLYNKLLVDNPMSAYMFCKFRKYTKDLIVVNIDTIPNGYTTQNVVDLCNGEFVKL